MATTQHQSFTPRNLPYLTADNDNGQFRAAYEERRHVIDQEIEKLRNKIKSHENRLKDLDKKEHEYSRMPRQEGSSNEVQELSGGTHRSTKIRPHLVSTTPLEPGLDPKMAGLLSIYKLKRKLKEEIKESEEEIKKLLTRRHTVVEKDRQLQFRQGILHAVNKDDEYLKQRKLRMSMEPRITPSDPFNSLPITNSSKPIDMEKLRLAKRGFYLGILENATSPKMTYTIEEKKYDVDRAAEVQLQHKRELDLKYDMAQHKVMYVKAKRNPTDPSNAKIIKESQLLRDTLSASKRKNKSPTNSIEPTVDPTLDHFETNLGKSTISQNLSQSENASKQAPTKPKVDAPAPQQPTKNAASVPATIQPSKPKVDVPPAAIQSNKPKVDATPTPISPQKSSDPAPKLPAAEPKKDLSKPDPFDNIPEPLTKPAQALPSKPSVPVTTNKPAVDSSPKLPVETKDPVKPAEPALLPNQTPLVSPPKPVTVVNPTKVSGANSVSKDSLQQVRATSEPPVDPIPTITSKQSLPPADPLPQKPVAQTTPAVVAKPAPPVADPEPNPSSPKLNNLDAEF